MKAFRTTVPKGENVLVAPAFDPDGDLNVDLLSATGSAWMDRETVRALRDHLTEVLGDAPEPFIPATVWQAARTPTAIELAAIVKAVAQEAGEDDVFGRMAPVAQALAEIGRRLEALR